MTTKKRQTRRSISVKGISYQWVKDFCDETDRSVSGYIEELIDKDLRARGIEKPKILRQDKPRPKKKDFENDPPWGNNFTF